MNEKKNVLIVCSDLNDFNKVNHINLDEYQEIILASDNIAIHKQSKKNNYINKTIFLQKSISHFKTSKIVVDMIDKVNIYFDKIIKLDIFNKNELFWTYHVDGGYTTQKLQDLILSIESAHLILDEFMISELIIIGNDNSFSIKALTLLSSKRGYKIKYYFRKFYIDTSSIKDFLRPIYYLFKTLIIKVKSTTPKYIIKNKMILFQICGATPNHIQNALFLQNEIVKFGFNPLNIIWGNTKVVKKINEMGYQALSIEKYLGFYDIFKSFYKIILIIKKFNLIKKFFYEKTNFHYRDLDLNDTVFEIVKKYLYTEAPENYRYRSAAKRLVSEISDQMVSVKYCAPKLLSQGSILSDLIEDRYLKFDYSVGANIPNPYTKYYSSKYKSFLSKNFIRFSNNEIEKAKLVNELNIFKDKVYVIGAGRANKHFKNLKVFTKENSKKLLGIKKDYEIYVLFELSMPVNGYISLEEVYNSLKIIIGFFINSTSMALIIKPNSSTDLSFFSEIFNNLGKNIFLMNKYDLPDHALNLADIIFTKFSTLGMEAMIYDSQVVSLLLDNEKKFKIYEGAAKYIYSKKELIYFLNNNFSSKIKFNQWKNLYKEKRKDFIKRYYPKLDQSSETIMVEMIKKNLTNQKKRVFNEKYN